jgi:protein-tyrosine phosphatase
LPVILFICTANQFRSPLAAAYFSRKISGAGLSGDWKVGSAGTWAVEGLPAHPLAIEAAVAAGLDLSRHRTREVNDKIIKAADLIVCMQKNHREALEAEFAAARGRIILLGSFAGLPADEIPDPAKESFSRPEVTAQMIYHCIDEGFSALVEMAKDPDKGGRNSSPDRF